MDELDLFKTDLESWFSMLPWEKKKKKGDGLSQSLQRPGGLLF